MNKNASPSALVVEGGAMRGIFASGVLDAFIEHDYRPFDFAIGVSAGATISRKLRALSSKALASRG